MNGAIAAYLTRGDRQLVTWIPEATNQGHSRALTAVARALKQRAGERAESQGLLIERIDGMPPAAHPVAPLLSRLGSSPVRWG